MRRTLRTAGVLIAVLIVVGVLASTLRGQTASTQRGDAPFNGSAAALGVHAAVVDLVPTNDGNGYWLVGADGGVFSYGNAAFYGSTGGIPLQAPVLDAEATPDSGGYWLLASDGGVFTFGNAPFLGSGAGVPHDTWFTGIATTPSGRGYWLLLADGGVFTFGDAPFLGSAAGALGGARAISIAPTPSGNGYWIAADNGGVFTFGDASFHGSQAGQPMNAPVVKIVPTVDGGGYWLVGADGGVFTFNAPMFGSAAGSVSNPVLAMAASPQGDGYWIGSANGGVIAYDTRGARGDINVPPPASNGDGATNFRVGPSNPAALRQVGGWFVVTTPGAVIENIDVGGPIEIRAPNVTVRNFRASQVNIDPSVGGIVLEDGEVHGNYDPNYTGDGVFYSNYTARRLDVHNTYDAFKAQGNTTIENCWVHDLNVLYGPDAGAGDYSHNDGVQISGGANVVIRNNWFERVGLNAAVFIDADQAPIDNVLVEGNYLDGGGITVYSIQSRSAPWFGAPTNVMIRNNLLGPNHKFDYALLGGDAAWVNNLDLNWRPIDPKRE